MGKHESEKQLTSSNLTYDIDLLLNFPGMDTELNMSDIPNLKDEEKQKTFTFGK